VVTCGENSQVDDTIGLERDCAAAWPAMVDEPLGQWRLRAAGGFTGRANSALTLGDPGVPVAEALATVVTFAGRNDIPATAHVISGAAVERDLTRAGWSVNQAHPGGAESVVMTGPLTGFDSTVPPGVSVPDVPPQDWWPLAVGTPAPTPAQRQVLAGRTGVGFGTVRADGQVVGIVRGAVVGDLLYIARLAVAPAHRRLGLAGCLLAALARWGARQGAIRCALQVATHNVGAISLYAALGCLPHHRYRYWIPAR
jgi:ribosomal protein S18 acetylase RimI-like enzyme